MVLFICTYFVVRAKELALLLVRLNAMRRSHGKIVSVMTNSCQHQLGCRVMEQGIEEQFLVGHRCQKRTGLFAQSPACQATMGSTSGQPDARW